MGAGGWWRDSNRSSSRELARAPLPPRRRQIAPVGPVGQLGLVDAEEDRAGLDEHRDRPALGEAKALGGGPGDRRHDLLASDIHGDLCHHRAELHVADGAVELVAGTEPDDLLLGSLLSFQSWSHARARRSRR